MKKTKIAALFLVSALIFGVMNVYVHAGDAYDEPVPDEPDEPYSYTENRG